MKRSIALAACALGSVCAMHADSAFAAEGASGFYLLGSRTSMAGFIPPPGTYVQSSNYFYSGNSNAQFEIAGLTLSGGVNADVYYNLPTALWVAPESVLGGNIAFSVIAPIGYKDVSAGATLSGPGGGVISGRIEDQETKFGDPVLGASLGWHEGKWHWTIGSLLNIPVGFWEQGNLANIGFNRWAIDANGGVTYLNMTTGLELSGAAGFTFNFENPDTDYKTGTEFHLELAAMQNFSKSFALGVSGYLYDQVTGDSGAGAKLGAFEGRVIGIGPAMNLNFELCKIPVTANLKYFREFAAQNRLEGDAGFVTFTMPLSVVGH